MKSASTWRQICGKLATSKRRHRGVKSASTWRQICGKLATSKRRHRGVIEGDIVPASTRRYRGLNAAPDQHQNNVIVASKPRQRQEAALQRLKSNKCLFTIYLDDDA